jgi:hypothetical protein
LRNKNPVNAEKYVAEFTQMRKIDRMNKTKLAAWVKAVGREQALAGLIANGISPRTAENLVDDKYDREPQRRIFKALVDAMAKDGFSLAGKKAS